MSLIKKCRELTVAQKIELLREVDEKKEKKSKLAEKYNIPASTLSSILKNRDRVEEYARIGLGPSAKRPRLAKYVALEKELHDYYVQAGIANMPVTDVALYKKANELALALKIPKFQGSREWLKGFKKRFKIKRSYVEADEAEDTIKVKQQKTRAHKDLTLVEKIRLLQDVDKAKKKKYEIAAKYGIPRSTLSTILKNRNRLEKSFKEGRNSLSSRLRDGVHEKLERKLYKYYTKNVAAKNPVTRSKLENQADKIALQLNIKSFQSSYGWFWRFARRFNIVDLIRKNKNTEADQEIDDIPTEKSSVDFGPWEQITDLSGTILTVAKENMNTEAGQVIDDIPTEKSSVDFGPWEQITDLSGTILTTAKENMNTEADQGIDDIPTEKSSVDFGPWEQITDLSGCCRLCLTQSGECSLTEIFAGTSDMGESWKHKITSLIPIKLDLVEGLPHGMCTNCVESLSRAHAFISLSVSVDEWLHKRFGMGAIKDECVDSDVEIVQHIEEDPLAIEQCHEPMEQELEDETYTDKPVKRKRGRPSGSTKKKPQESHMFIDAETGLPKRKRGRPRKTLIDPAASAISTEGIAYPYIENEIFGSADFQVTLNKEDESRGGPCSSNFYSGDPGPEFVDCKPKLGMIVIEENEGHPTFPEHEAEEFAECESDLWPEEMTKAGDEDDNYRVNPIEDNNEDIDSPEVLDCAVCSKTFTNHKSLKRHLRYHNESGRFPCDMCSLAFGNQMGLLEHYRTHIGYRPYECTKCPKAFSLQAGLTKHERTHTGERPYTCNVCSKTFSLLCVLRTHERVHTGDKPYACTLCSKAFSTQTSRKKHMLVHTGEKPFACNFCPMHFTESSKRSLHERRKHTHERTVKCTMCEEMFVDFEHRARHIAEKHEDL